MPSRVLTISRRLAATVSLKSFVGNVRERVRRQSDLEAEYISEAEAEGEKMVAQCKNELMCIAPQIFHRSTLVSRIQRKGLLPWQRKWWIVITIQLTQLEDFSDVLMLVESSVRAHLSSLGKQKYRVRLKFPSARLNPLQRLLRKGRRP